MWRPNTDGTKRFMTRTDMLTKRTMFLIGRIPLDMEHYLLWKLHYRLKQIPRAPSVHGCINDCLYLRATPPHKCQCYLCTSGEGPCDEMNQRELRQTKPTMRWLNEWRAYSQNIIGCLGVQMVRPFSKSRKTKGRMVMK